MKLNRNKIGETDLKSWLKYRDYNPKKLSLKNSYSEEFITFLEESMNIIEYNSDNIAVKEYIERISVDYNKYEVKNEKKKYTILKYMVRRELKDNDIFGEVSFLNLKRKRTATVITNNECHFLVMNKANFNNILLIIYEKIKYDNLLFLTKKDLFKGVDKSKFSEKFYDYFILSQINNDKYLISENDEPKRIFFIKSGEFEITFKKSLKQIYDIINYYKGKLVKKKINIGFEYDDEKFEEYSQKSKLIKVNSLF
jgi:CRP-like cAMP-binding protein